MENLFSSNSVTGDHIATKFGTCHDSPAVVPCAKFCSDHFIFTWTRAKWNFHHIWIVMEKLLVKWAPDTHRQIIAQCSWDLKPLDRNLNSAWLSDAIWRHTWWEHHRYHRTTLSIMPLGWMSTIQCNWLRWLNWDHTSDFTSPCVWSATIMLNIKHPYDTSGDYPESNQLHFIIM